MRDMDLKVKEHNLTSLEKIKALHLSAEPFTVDNNLITPTLKLKRYFAKVHFKNAIEQMYSETSD
jgi:long-chain acyl-CoA synthetase